MGGEGGRGGGRAADVTPSKVARVGLCEVTAGLRRIACVAFFECSSLSLSRSPHRSRSTYPEGSPRRSQQKACANRRSSASWLRRSGRPWALHLMPHSFEVADASKATPGMVDKH